MSEKPTSLREVTNVATSRLPRYATQSGNEAPRIREAMSLSTKDLFEAVNACLNAPDATEGEEDDGLICKNDGVKLMDNPLPELMEVHLACQKLVAAASSGENALLEALKPFLFKFAGVSLDGLEELWCTTSDGCEARINNLNKYSLQAIQAQILVKNGVAQLVPLSSEMVLAFVKDAVQLTYAHAAEADEPAAAVVYDGPILPPDELSLISAFAQTSSGRDTSRSHFKYIVLKHIADNPDGADVSFLTKRIRATPDRIDAVVRTLNTESGPNSITERFGARISVTGGSHFALRPYEKKEKRRRVAAY